MANPTTPKTTLRRLGYGCLTLVVLLLVAFAALVLIARYMIRYYTETSPVPMLGVSLPTEERRLLKENYKAFEKAVDSGAPAPQFKITDTEINALIGDSKPLHGLIYVSTTNGQLNGQVSLPLDKSGIPFTKGRYLNGSCVFEASVQNGVLVVTARSIIVKGKPLPEIFMSRIRRQNLLDQVRKDPDAANAISRFENVLVEPDAVTITGK